MIKAIKRVCSKSERSKCRELVMEIWAPILTWLVLASVTIILVTTFEENTTEERCGTVIEKGLSGIGSSNQEVYWVTVEFDGKNNKFRVEEEKYRVGAEVCRLFRIQAEGVTSLSVLTIFFMLLTVISLILLVVHLITRPVRA